MPAVAYEGWAIVELMGHVRMAGQVREVEMYGAKLLQLDVPGLDDVPGAKPFTTFVSGSSLYRVTPTTEETAKGVIRRAQPRPVQPYEVEMNPRQLAPAPARDADVVDEDDYRQREAEGEDF